MTPQILALDITGNPFRWLGLERAIYYVASGKVAWAIGDEAAVFHGGVQRISGLRSQLALQPVIALSKSEGMAKHFGPLKLGHDNRLLFRRDRDICAYCGEKIAPDQRTRDHIIPRARGGADIWSNVVTAHRSCNMRKGCHSPEEIGMPLLYVPYTPCRNEHFLLSGRNILADQLDYLSSRLPKHSRAML
jgi:hypothetical protein